MDMNVPISELNVERIRRKVDSGRYASADDVLDSALALLDERDEALQRELAGMRVSVRRGAQQADAGQVVPATEVFNDLRRRNAALAKQSG